MSECRHFADIEKDRGEYGYHVPLGPNGIDCCVKCYSVLGGQFDMSVFTALNSCFFEQWQHDYGQAQWLLAEKDAEIDALREQIEILEAAELVA